MSRSRARLAADWFAKLRQNAATNAVEHIDVTDVSGAGYITSQLTGTLTEDIYTLSGTTPSIAPDNGSIQFWTLTANSTPTFDSSWENGETVVFMIEDGTAYTVTWPTTNWQGGAAPALSDAGHNVLVIWKAGDEFYGGLSGLFS